VIDRIFYEFRGQPGLTCWFGELLTEEYNDNFTRPITKEQFDYVYTEAINVLPNNKKWLLKDAPRRKDLRIFVAVYHFSLYMYLYRFLRPKHVQVWPEFPTGNGKINLLIKYANQLYGIELKSYTDESAYHDAIDKAENYAVQLSIPKISLVFFVDIIEEKIRKKYKIEYIAPDTGIQVDIIFIACEEEEFS